MQNYVSSIEEKVKQSKLNNVIQSLDCLICCTTNDQTCQNYGMLCYCGPITPGQVINGTRKPMKAGTPIIVDETYLGKINNDGNLVVTNTCATKSSWNIESKYQDITYELGNNASWGTSWACCLCSCVSSETHSTCDGWDVTTTCTTYCYLINESNQFSNAYTVYDCEYYIDGYLMCEIGRFCMSDGRLYAYVTCCNDYEGHTYCWGWNNLSCFCDGRTCFSNMPPWGITVDDCYSGSYQDRCTYERRGFDEDFSLRMCAVLCCTYCVTLCTKVIDCVDFCVRYL